MKKNEIIKVSVVIPVYNEEKYLKRSLNSLMAQTYSNIEVILVNDGSTDNSFKILKKYEKTDNRFLVINKINGGLVDATITGIKFATGDYICFLDPDDYIGSDFIMNYISLIDKYGQLDFFATGFYRDNKGNHFPYNLKENVLLSHKDIRALRSKFLYNGTDTVSNCIFISRWNKCYKTDVVKEISKKFRSFKDVSLGEDTIFTYIMLNVCKSGLATTFINSYYYNVGNANSMMNNADLNNHISRAYTAYSKFRKLLYQDNQKPNQAYILYYDLIQSLIERVKKDKILAPKLFKRLKSDDTYNIAINLLLKGNISLRQKYSLYLYKYSNNYFIYYRIKNSITFLLKKYRMGRRKSVFLVKNIKKHGLIKGYRNLKFLNNRINAQEDLKKYLPLLEKQISPLIKNYTDKSTDLENAPIEKNIFVFWWDGLESAPDIVKLCISSIKRNYKDYNTIVITKNNFKKYSHINENILQDFKKGKISIQTFSDILRFNLLYYNGGIWSDATIFYRKKFDILNGLKNKSFESVCFNTSKNFLKYKNETCSWSVFLMASRKFGLFAKMMNEVYEQYYLKYGTFSMYFFTDAVIMLAKINNIDNNVLDKTKKSKYNMFDLSKILNFEYYDQEFNDNTQIPQKLSWFIKVNSVNEYKTNYNHIEEILN